MDTKLQRVGTTYLPVRDTEEASKWYQEKLGAVENYRDEDKAILEFANQSFFLVKAREGERAVFLDIHGNERFMMTFEVDGFDQLKKVHKTFKEKGVRVGEIEDRGHPGNNFIFYDPDGNSFDVWSELSPVFKEKYSVK
ncbi:VOC family protein [Alkalihalobacillus sp. AL-G]|uniref:VOC family protein n=1 Tax=Alkalihalobacillus sp. AL-G TaxID=2926399 RepID=UPI00272BC24A|nr:VOC family protein [Alkalihalobacillus sp. AL-G]WLD93772.1 VOC family protein [Alkalihalobacillus sp. AL-G]